MTALTFDTLKFARRLIAAGMDARLAEEQTEAMAEVLQTNLDALATKTDIAGLSRDTEQSRRAPAWRIRRISRSG